MHGKDFEVLNYKDIAILHQKRSRIKEKAWLVAILTKGIASLDMWFIFITLIALQFYRGENVKIMAHLPQALPMSSAWRETPQGMFHRLIMAIFISYPYLDAKTDPIVLVYPP